MNIRLCRPRDVSVSAIQYVGYGWFDTLKELLPSVELQTTPFSTAVTLKLDNKYKPMQPNDWAVVHEGGLTVFTPEAFDLVFGDAR